jgi:DNA mismatch repair protein MutL
VGTKINVTGGKIKTVTEVGAPAGTLVSVANIFFNTPARRKFLKSINTEMGHIADTIASMALCRPSVQFRLSHNEPDREKLGAGLRPSRSSRRRAGQEA